MRPGPPASGRRARRIALAVLGLCTPCFAAEPAAPATTPGEAAPAGRKDAAAGEALDAARRDFQTLKATRDPAQQPREGLPKVGMPSLATGSGEALPKPAARPDSTATPGKRPGNWLVDAMDKSEREAAERRGDRRTDSPLEDFRGETAQLRARDRLPSDAAENRRAFSTASPTGAGAAESVNPFTRYLGDWMTPRDYAVLKPALEVPAFVRGGSEGRDASLVAPLSSPPNGFQRPGSVMAAGAATPTVAPRENPYLQPLPALAAPASTPPRPAASMPHPTSLSGLAPPAVMPAATAAPVTPQPAPRSQIPDFVKPNRDEKYFKQLKRF